MAFSWQRYNVFALRVTRVTDKYDPLVVMRLYNLKLLSAWFRSFKVKFCIKLKQTVIICCNKCSNLSKFNSPKQLIVIFYDTLLYGQLGKASVSGQTILFRRQCALWLKWLSQKNWKAHRTCLNNIVIDRDAYLHVCNICVFNLCTDY